MLQDLSFLIVYVYYVVVLLFRLPLSDVSFDVRFIVALISSQIQTCVKDTMIKLDRRDQMSVVQTWLV